MQKIADIIRNEVIGDDADTRNKFLECFSGQAEEFILLMIAAFENWEKFDGRINGDEKKAYISAVIYSAINSTIVSMKLFLSGYATAAGNIQRQALESIALACLCASKDLDVLDRFIDGKYSTNKAIRDAMRSYKSLGLNRDSILRLEKSSQFYDKYSHPTLLAITTHVSFVKKGEELFLGASFDPGKMKGYEKEISSRVSLARAFENIIHGIGTNVDAW